MGQTFFRKVLCAGQSVGLPLGRVVVVALTLAMQTAPARGHPHVFIDGGVDFVFDGSAMLEALEVTWLYDEFETLYILSLNGIGIENDGTLAEADRQALVRFLGNWSEDFSGSAHLTIDGMAVELEQPSGFDVEMVDGRLRATFIRRLPVATDLGQREVEVAFYEATYFYAFFLTNTPAFTGEAAGCTARVVPFDPDAQSEALQATLLELDREEVPEIEDVGALFADRIELRCA